MPWNAILKTLPGRSPAASPRQSVSSRFFIHNWSLVNLGMPLDWLSRQFGLAANIHSICQSLDLTSKTPHVPRFREAELSGASESPADGTNHPTPRARVPSLKGLGFSPLYPSTPPPAPCWAKLMPPLRGWFGVFRPTLPNETGFSRTVLRPGLMLLALRTKVTENRTYADASTGRAQFALAALVLYSFGTGESTGKPRARQP